MQSTTVPAYAYWAGHSYYPTLLDPQGTASLAMVVLVALLVVLPTLSYRFWIHRKRRTLLQNNLDYMVRTWDAYRLARREGREQQQQVEPPNFQPGDIEQTEWKLKDCRRHGYFFIAGFAVLGLFATVLLATMAMSWGHWWIEGGYQCSALGPGAVVYDQLDPQGIQTDQVGHRMNLCAPGIFTQGAQFFAHPKQAIHEALY